MSIYNTESDPIKKEAIIMLVKKVSEELEEYINNVKSITEIFSHSKETKKRQNSGNSKSEPSLKNIKTPQPQLALVFNNN